METNKTLLLQLVEEFYPYAKEQLGFQEECKIVFSDDDENASDPLGKTAYYDPEDKKITIFVTGRHPKDILRSVAHELVHHKQNGEGRLGTNVRAGEGYAQKDPHLRKMEEEAFLKGNMIFRDWEDSRKQALQELKDRRPGVYNMDWRQKIFVGRNNKLYAKLIKDQSLSERIRFDKSSFQTETTEDLDPELVKDIQDMLGAGESDEDILHQLVRGEGIDSQQAQAYIDAANGESSIDG